MVNRSLPGALPGARVLYRMQASWEQMGVVRLAFKEQLIRRTYPGPARTSSARANSVSRDAPGASGPRRPARLAFALSLVRSSQPARRSHRSLIMIARRSRSAGGGLVAESLHLVDRDAPGNRGNHLVVDHQVLVGRARTRG